MSFNPDNYDLKKLSEYPDKNFNRSLSAQAFFPAVDIDELGALANYKISLQELLEFIVHTGDYTNIIDYRPTPYYTATGLNLTIKAGWRLDCPNGFESTGEYQNEEILIDSDRAIDMSQYGSGIWILFVTASDTFVLPKAQLITRPTRTVETSPLTGTICYETDTNTWWRYAGTAWNQIIGMPLIKATITDGTMTVSLSNSLMRNRLNLEYLLIQAGINIPETRGPFERVMSNVKKSGADLLYYIPAHTQVDLANYPDTLDFLKTAYGRAAAAGPIESSTYGAFYRDPETGIDFATPTVYSQAYSNTGICPFIGIPADSGWADGATQIWTPKTSHGDLIMKKDPTSSDTKWARVYADGWVEQGGYMYGSVAISGQSTFTLPFEMANTTDYFVNFQAMHQGTGQGYQPCEVYPARTTTTVSCYQTAGYYGLEWQVRGLIAPATLAKIPNGETFNEYYLIGNVVSNIPADLAGQLATILNAYNQIVQQGADFFSIQATDATDAQAKSIANPTKFVYVADP